MNAHTFESYRDKYENLRMKRENGILEVALHTRGGPLVFNGYVHEALVHAFRDIGDDRDNHVVILTGTGNDFCTQLSPEGFDFFTPTGDRKSTRLNSSHQIISYAVFCLKKKKIDSVREYTHRKH